MLISSEGALSSVSIGAKLGLQSLKTVKEALLILIHHRLVSWIESAGVYEVNMSHIYDRLFYPLIIEDASKSFGLLARDIILSLATHSALSLEHLKSLHSNSSETGEFYFLNILYINSFKLISCSFHLTHPRTPQSN